MPDKMFLETVHSPGLSHLSYMIGHQGQAAVIDARRDVQPYIDLARQHSCQINYAFETHKNEDYITGSRDLARRTGCRILHGEGLDWGFGETLAGGETFELGNIRLTVLRTPGHTDDSISIALADTSFSDEAVAVFTGDALFLGDVGRTDFYPDRAEEVAGLLYDSIFEKILPLGEHVLLYPAHGAGSVCGSGMASREFSTLGYEKQFSPALQVDSREEFIQNKTQEHHYKPPYFQQMEVYNKKGNAPQLAELPNPQPLAGPAFESAMKDGAVVVDIREPEAFAGAFVPGSLNIPLNMIPAYAGWLLDYDHDILLIADDTGDVEKAVRYLVRIGYDRIAGYLRGGLHGWEVAGLEFDRIGVMTAEQLQQRIENEKELKVLDVRKQGEYEQSHIEGAIHIFLGELPDRVEEIPQDANIATFCGSGRRASIAASILRKHGRRGVSNNLGSMAACQSVGCEVATA